MSERQESGRSFYVYRAFDSYGGLLYVGMTVDLEKRIKTHGRSLVRWTRQMASLTAEQYATRAEASRAEVRAIRTESPIYNVAGSANGDVALYLRWLADKTRFADDRPATPEEREALFRADFDEWVRIWRMATAAEREARITATIQKYQQGRTQAS